MEISSTAATHQANDSSSSSFARPSAGSRKSSIVRVAPARFCASSVDKTLPYSRRSESTASVSLAVVLRCPARNGTSVSIVSVSVSCVTSPFSGFPFRYSWIPAALPEPS